MNQWLQIPLFFEVILVSLTEAIKLKWCLKYFNEMKHKYSEVKYRCIDSMVFFYLMNKNM